MRRIRWVLAGLLVVATTVAGCGEVVHGKANVASQKGAAPQTNKDRDTETVLNRLAALDACALVPDTAPGAQGLFATAESPYTCTLRLRGGSLLTVSVGATAEHLDRVFGTKLTLAGATVYQRKSEADDPDGPSGGVGCTQFVPTSFGTGITFELDTGLPEACGPLGRLVAAAVPRINGSAAPLAPGSRPAAGWIGCLVLGTVLDAGAKYRLAALDSAPGVALSGCRAYPADHNKDAVNYELKYGFWYPDEATGTAGGKSVEVHNESASCRVKWNQGPSGVPDPPGAVVPGEHNTVVGELSGVPCEQVQQWVAKVAGSLASAPPQATLKPLPHLTYAPGEPDEEVVGACTNFVINTAQGCTPALPATVPDDPAEALQAGDNNVTCAAFEDAVHAAFGAEYQPVSWGEHCIFVSEAHPLQLTADLNPVDRADSYGQGADLYADRTTITIGGHPAVEFSVTDHSEFDVYVSPTGSVGDRGNVHLQVDKEPVRGEQDDPGHRAALTDAERDKARRAITQVMTTHFR